MRCADELHAALGNRARSYSFQLTSNLVDDDHLRHVILHGLNHQLVLQRGVRHLHAPRTPDRRVGNVAIAGDLIACIDNDHALHLAAQTRRLAQQCRFAYARSPQQQDAAFAVDDILDDLDRTVDSAPHATGKADDIALTVADGRDAMQCALDASTVVGAKVAHARHHPAQVVERHFMLAQHQLAIGKARFGQPPQIHDDFDQVALALRLFQRHTDAVGQDGQQQIKIVGNLKCVHI